jgi:hypothetical protein
MKKFGDLKTPDFRQLKSQAIKGGRRPKSAVQYRRFVGAKTRRKKTNVVTHKHQSHKYINNSKLRISSSVPPTEALRQSDQREFPSMD